MTDRKQLAKGKDLISLLGGLLSIKEGKDEG
jgi:hypothetical protein